MAALSKPLDMARRRPTYSSAVVIVSGTAAAALCYSAWLRYSSSKRNTLRRSGPSALSLEAAEKAAERAAAKLSAKEKKIKAHVDWQFFAQLFKIIKIIIPSVFSSEVFYLVLVAISLLCRTYADVWMITNTTIIENGIIQRNPAMFKKYLMHYFLAMPAISFVNNLLKLGLGELKLRFRSRLSKHLYQQYLKDFTFYKMSNLDNRIANADQLLTQDVEKFCDGIVDLYSNLSKPVVDVSLYIYKLGSAIGYQAPLSLLGYLFASGVLLTRLRRPIGRLTVREQQLEGEYRFVNSRVIVNSEEIAFYGGQHSERALVGRVFDRLVKHLRKSIYFRFGIGFLDNIIAKYFATVVGWLVVAKPFLSTERNKLSDMDRNQLVQVYYDNGRMMFSLAVALGRLALAGRELTRLAGFTARMSELMAVLKDLNQGKYTRTMVNTTVQDEQNGTPKAQLSNFTPGSGEVIICDYVIKFEDVPLVTPNGDVLIEKLDLEVRSGVNILVCGPNGCGKSSLFRILGELWPLFGGRLTKPASGNLFYIPQRPYMTLGTLRDQIIYPDSQSDMHAKGICDEQLVQHLERVQLSYILAREGGWHAQQDWMDVLSGGEKQRIAMARLFYHQPQFAILDECTSAVSVDVEGNMYSYCKEVGITLFTVSHRKSLWRYHEYYLHMDGRGSYTFAPIDSDTQQFGS